MSFAKSFYADQKPVEKTQENLSPVSAAIPATTPVAEDALTPAQIQEAIRMYRSVLSSSSAPSSPVRHAAPARPTVHSNYYGGGPTDIPQSYLHNYSPRQQRNVEPLDQQLVDRLQGLQLEAAEPVAPVAPVAQQQKVTAAPVVTRRMYDDEESGYCFNRKKGAEPEEEVEEEPKTPTAPQNTAYVPVQTVNYSNNNDYSKGYGGPSEYLGMANDNKFIYDAQKALPAAYAHQNNYNLVSSVPQAVIARPQEPEQSEDVPASPAATSRFRGLIQRAQTPIQSTAPIVVERVAEPAVVPNYGAFVPVNQMSMESEYQLPVLNDLASCIEHY